MSVRDNSPTGYILDVDVVYPCYLHDLLSDLQMLPENTIIEGTKERKLLTRLQPKFNLYVNT